MADTKISQMPSATSLTGAEIVPLVQGGINVQTSLDNIAAVDRNCGAWQSNQSQVGSASAGTPITVNVTDVADGITANANAFTVPVTGTYNLQFSSQFINSENNQNDVAIWVKINGTDLANSAGVVTVPSRKSALINGKTIAGWNYYLTMTAGQYAQLYWQPESANVVMTTIAATPTYPGAASVIVTMGQVA